MAGRNQINLSKVVVSWNDKSHIKNYLDTTTLSIVCYTGETFSFGKHILVYDILSEMTLSYFDVNRKEQKPA